MASHQITLKGTLHWPYVSTSTIRSSPLFSSFNLGRSPNLSLLALKFSSLFFLFTIRICQTLKYWYVTNLHYVILESSRVWILMLEFTLCHVFMSKSHWSFLVSWVLILCTSSLCCNLQPSLSFQDLGFCALDFWVLVQECSSLVIVSTNSFKNLIWQLQHSFSANAWSITKSWSWFMVMDLQTTLDFEIGKCSLETQWSTSTQHNKCKKKHHFFILGMYLHV